jgi:DDE family transposase
VLLKGRQWLPLARSRLSNTHPNALSQNQVEESLIPRWTPNAGPGARIEGQALWDAIGWVPPGTPVLARGDRGLGRKGLFHGLLERKGDGLFRLRSDLHVTDRGRWRHLLEVARALKRWGAATGREGRAKPIQGRGVVFRARLTEEEGDGPEITFGVLWPEQVADPLIVGTTLSVATLQAARAVLRWSEPRWVIETSFETLKGAFGLEQFRVRQWQATERRLNLVAMAFTRLVLLMPSTQKNVQVLVAQAVRVLKHGAAFKRLTLGKLREAMALDFDENREAWYALSR